MKNAMKSVLIGGILILAAQASNAEEFVVKSGPTLQAQAYIDKDYKNKDQLRYHVRVQPTKDGSSWDFTLDDDPVYHHTDNDGNLNFTPYKAKQKTATIKLTLHRYETLDEILTFKNLDLMPSPSKNELSSRFLSMKREATLTTPSGISVTIPVQGYKSLFEAFTFFNGNAGALFFDVRISPDRRESILPMSPLFKKYKKPVTIKLECAKPNDMVWYMADNTFKRLAVGLPNLATVQHLDALSLIARQRVELRSVPVTLQVPIVR